MKNPLQPRNWLSGMRLPAVSAALALAAVLVSTVITTSVAQAQTLKVLHSFDGADGANPNALVQATNGDLYGTTFKLGTNNAGTIFKITPTGTLTTVYSFCSQSNCTDGENPHAGLVQDTNGDLYGTTEHGGTNNAGTVFKITPSGTLTTLYHFTCVYECAERGSSPDAALVQDTNGDLYGTTGGGGPSDFGTVFKITSRGTLNTLHTFDGEDGFYPQAALIQAPNGDLYGTMENGGPVTSNGTFFKITPTGTLTTLYSFCSKNGCTDGINPNALVQAANGNFYGTTILGGVIISGLCNDSCGTVFKITPSGVLTTLYSFCSQGNCADGANPYTGLVQATDGNFYGTTSVGGANTTENCENVYIVGCGTIFKITPTGTLTTLYSFCSLAACADGDEPGAALVQDTNGDLYGTTEDGGASGFGSVFSLSLGLGPFVETRLTSGKVGAAVQILGTKLTGATSVKFNGKAAVFKVVSSSEITTTVPAGATTGKVEVKTPSGTLISNVNFRVTK